MLFARLLVHLPSSAGAFSKAARVFSILFFNFPFRKIYFQASLGKVYKPPVRPEPVNRVENAVREHAVRGPEAPRAPELDIPRPSAGAGVGALSSGLVFELGVCPECGGRIVESNGLLVCGNCGRARSAAQSARREHWRVVRGPGFEPGQAYASGAPIVRS